jgi:hypothetical protein
LKARASLRQLAVVLLLLLFPVCLGAHDYYPVTN